MSALRSLKRTKLRTADENPKACSPERVRMIKRRASELAFARMLTRVLQEICK